MPQPHDDPQPVTVNAPEQVDLWLGRTGAYTPSRVFTPSDFPELAD